MKAHELKEQGKSNKEIATTLKVTERSVQRYLKGIKRMARKVKAVPMPDKYKRYMIVDENTGEILDDAQGYGYKTAQKAHLAWNYKHATSKQSHNRKLNQKFVKEHKAFVREWDAVLFDYLKCNEKPSYSEFKEMLANEVPDFEGSSRSLFYYLQKH